MRLSLLCKNKVELLNTEDRKRGWRSYLCLREFTAPWGGPRNKVLHKKENYLPSYCPLRFSQRRKTQRKLLAAAPKSTHKT